MEISEKLLNEKLIVLKQQAKEENNTTLLNILNHIAQNPQKRRYTIIDLQNSSKFEHLDQLMDVIILLTSKAIQLFTLRFLYFSRDNEVGTIEISPESYFVGKLHNHPPEGVSEFDPSRLGFDCFIHENLMVEPILPKGAPNPNP